MTMAEKNVFIPPTQARSRKSTRTVAIEDENSDSDSSVSMYSDPKNRTSQPPAKSSSSPSKLRSTAKLIEPRARTRRSYGSSMDVKKRQRKDTDSKRHPKTNTKRSSKHQDSILLNVPPPPPSSSLSSSRLPTRSDRAETKGGQSKARVSSSRNRSKSLTNQLEAVQLPSPIAMSKTHHERDPKPRSTKESRRRDVPVEQSRGRKKIPSQRKTLGSKRSTQAPDDPSEINTSAGHDTDRVRSTGQGNTKVVKKTTGVKRPVGLLDDETKEVPTGRCDIPPPTSDTSRSKKQKKESDDTMPSVSRQATGISSGERKPRKSTTKSTTKDKHKTKDKTRSSRSVVSSGTTKSRRRRSKEAGAGIASKRSRPNSKPVGTVSTGGGAVDDYDFNF